MTVHIERGGVITAEWLNGVADAAYAPVRTGRQSGGGSTVPRPAEPDRRVARCVVTAASTQEIAPASDVTYTLHVLETGATLVGVPWHKRVIPLVYDDAHLVRPAPVGSPGLLWHFTDADGLRTPRAWIFDEHAARAPCGS